MSTLVGLPERRGSRRLDVALSLLAVSGLAACVIAAFAQGEEGPRAGPASDLIGETTAVVGDPMLRRASSLVWSSARVGEGLRAGDVLYVPGGSELRLALRGGAHVTLAEKSLVVLGEERREGARRLAVKRGSVLAAAAREPVVVDTGAGDLLLAPGAAGEVTTETSGAARVQMIEGEARLFGRGRDVPVGARTEWVVSAEGELVEKRGISVGLRAPSHRARVYAEGPVAVVFAWRLGRGVSGHRLRLEVVHEGRRVHDVALADGQTSAELVVPGPGVYRWRIDDETPEEHATPRRVFVVVKPDAPVPLEPPDGSALTRDEARSVVFAWSAVEGARAYRLQLSAVEGGTAEGGNVNLQVELASTRHRHELPLARGRYLWTVEAVFDDAAARSRPALLLVDTAASSLVEAAPEVTAREEAPPTTAPATKRAAEPTDEPAASFEWTRPARDAETSWGTGP